MEDPAEYLARRMRALYRVSRSATVRELRAICRARGCQVFTLPRLARPGYYVNRPRPAIFLRSPARRRVLAHELYHHLVSDNAEHGVIYGFPDFVDGPEEAGAEQFAELLCPGGQRVLSVRDEG